jgi:hypothetical protein
VGSRGQHCFPGAYKKNRPPCENVCGSPTGDTGLSSLKKAGKPGTGILFAKAGDRYFICRTPNIPVKGGEKRGDSKKSLQKVA